VFGFACFNILLYSALEHTTAINVAIEQAGMPMVIFLANFFLFRIRVTPAGRSSGFLLTLAGVAITASSGSLERLIGLELNRGDALMLLAVLLLRRLHGGASLQAGDLHWQSMITVMAAAALPDLPALRRLGSGAGTRHLARQHAAGWSPSLPPCFPRWSRRCCSSRATSSSAPTAPASSSTSCPIFGTLLSVMILGEMLHLYHVVALGLVLGGIWLSERGKR
jgi:drug/metabolite transporter (DMT)-like permease